MANEQNEDQVDLNRLSQRELLILVYTKVKALEETSGDHTKKQNMTDIEMAVIKTKLQVQAAIVGFIAGLASSIIMFFITNK